jgi:hypothetical protein
MYLFVSAFHSPPWLNLIGGQTPKALRRERPVRPLPKADRPSAAVRRDGRI